MDRKTKLRTIYLLLIVALAGLILMPSVVPSERIPDWYQKGAHTVGLYNRIQLGLDIQGGWHIVYSIDLDMAVADKATEIRRDFEAKMEELGIKGRVTTPRVPLGAVTIALDAPEDVKRIDAPFLSDYDEELVMRECPEGEASDRSVCVRVSSDYAAAIKASALEQAIRTIRERLNERGVGEPSVVTKGDQIIVELPGRSQDDIRRDKETIERAAKLEFKIVADRSEYMQKLYAFVEGDPVAKERGIGVDIDQWSHEESGSRFRDWYLTAQDRTEKLGREEAEARGCWDPTREVAGEVECTIQGRTILGEYIEELESLTPEEARQRNPAAVTGEDFSLKLDDDFQIGFEHLEAREGSRERRDPTWRTYYLHRAVELGGSAVTNARVYFNPTTNRPEVLVNFTRWGGRRFGELTGANVGRKMAIILDDRISSAPIIQTKIDGGSSSITVGASDPNQAQKEAEDLVNVLRTGSLPAPLREDSSSVVGPLLGRDAVDKAKNAFGLGALLVLLVMVLYYRKSGIVAISALALNIFFMMTVLAAFRATLTLPGIAALVLTIGMAVDANIIIFERIREELRAGKSVKGAVDAGFKRGFAAIIDAQLTTGVAGYVLYQYGSGPIKGFAVMLMIGIVCTLFTATWCTRLFFDYWVGRRGKSTVLAI